MAWIKRNLYFVIGSAVALLLMGAAGWFLYAKWDLNNQVLEKLNQDYEELKRLNAETPHPGSGQVDNVKLAREQEQELRGFIQKSRGHFRPIEAIPALAAAKLTDRDFSAALSRTINELQRLASDANVAVASNFNFSFEAQKQKVSFPAGSLPALSVQLGEVKAISELLLRAKINALDYVRRERVCPDDTSAPSQTDYLNVQSVTNDLAVLTRYEVGFRGFSSELAAVLAGFASSPYGLLVKSLNVEPAVASATDPSALGYGADPANPMAGEMARMLRYQRMNAEGMMPAVPAPVAAPATPAATRGGLQTVLDEKPLKITLEIVVVKLLPSK